LLYVRLGGATRGKWRIPDGKVESGLFSYSVEDRSSGSGEQD
jgi:hypothetical protein